MTTPLLTLKDLQADTSLPAEDALRKAVSALRRVESFAAAAERTARKWRQTEESYVKDGNDEQAAHFGGLAGQAEHTAGEIRTAISRGINTK